MFAACAVHKDTGRSSLVSWAPETAYSYNIPAVDGALTLDVVYPLDGAKLPRVDSNFIFGSVGSGKAKLHINGRQVPVAPNGSFLAWLPMPKDGKYNLTATHVPDSNGITVAKAVRTVYFETPATPQTSVKPKKRNILFSHGEMGAVVRCSDTLATGSDAAPAFPAPGEDRAYMWPRGARVRLLEYADEYYRVKLTYKIEAWIADSNIEEVQETQKPLDRSFEVAISEQRRFTDVVIPTEHAPFSIDFMSGSLHVTLYAPILPHLATSRLVGGSVVASCAWHAKSGMSAAIELGLTPRAWGYKAFYDTLGNLHVHIRRAPMIDTLSPLEGVRILVDAGHPPIGATGPTRLTEADANLSIALALKELLVRQGAEVVMTRTTPLPLVSSINQTQELRARAQMAVDRDVDILLSMHNNAFPDGTNPFADYGTSTFYYNQPSAPLAQCLDSEIVKVTGIPNLGAMHKSLAIARPTWMPAVLTESLYLLFPEQEAALRDPEFIARLARAHLRGLLKFLRQTATAK